MTTLGFAGVLAAAFFAGCAGPKAKLNPPPGCKLRFFYAPSDLGSPGIERDALWVSVNAKPSLADFDLGYVADDGAFIVLSEGGPANFQVPANAVREFALRSRADRSILLRACGDATARVLGEPTSPNASTFPPAGRPFFHHAVIAFRTGDGTVEVSLDARDGSGFVLEE